MPDILCQTYEHSNNKKKKMLKRVQVLILT